MRNNRIYGSFFFKVLIFHINEPTPYLSKEGILEVTI